MSLSQKVIETLRAEVKPAMGCTEPVAVALAVSKAKELCFGEKSFDLKNIEIHVYVSPNILKNGLGVGIPGTDQVGLMMAIALGITSCESKNGLEVFKNVMPADIELAFQLIQGNQIFLNVADTDKKVYIEAEVKSGVNFGKATIQDRHDAFTYLESDQGILFKSASQTTAQSCDSPVYKMTIDEIIDIAEALPFNDIEFLLEGYTMNEKVAEYGIKNACGMGIGHSLTNSKFYAPSLMCDAMSLTAGASDARMSGALLPVMSSNGSGNNGLTAILPISAYAKHEAVSQDNLARAAVISHLVNSVIKYNIGRLSALCGCGVAAGTGAAVAITWLMGGDKKQIHGAVQNMLANTTGMVCDGAKLGCSLKLATSASAAIQSAILATDNVITPSGNGIIGKNADESIKNLGILSREAMDTVDQVILKIMTAQV